MKKNAIWIFLIILFWFFVALTAAYADQYGYGQPSPSQSIDIEKTIFNGSIFVDNMSASDPRFAPGSQITFQLKVKNTSNVTLFNVIVKDFVPSFLNPLEGPGAFDSSTRIITFNAGNFEPNEERVFTLKMQVAGINSLPSDKSLVCQVNKAQASTDNVFDEDTSQFCIEKQVTGVSVVPSAGPELGIFLISGELVMLGFGLTLRKKK